jgi:hypothetical protein
MAEAKNDGQIAHWHHRRNGSRRIAMHPIGTIPESFACRGQHCHKGHNDESSADSSSIIASSGRESRESKTEKLQ